MKEIKNGKSKKRGVFGWIFMIIVPLLIVIAVLIYTVAFSLAVRNKVNEWQSSSKSQTNPAEYSLKEWQLIKDKALLNARTSLASNDSIGLTLNLQDSLVQLEINGVVLKQIHFKEAEISRFFKAFKPGSYVSTFSKPFKITGLGGTIVKEPFTVEKAPKDTIEAALNITKVDTSKVEFVEWHLELNHAFVVSFVQSDHEIGKIDRSTLEYRYRRDFNTLTGNIRNIIHLQRPAYNPRITIYIPKNEAKSFYRGLSVKGGVVIRL
jgi:hypothetical protein